MQKDRYRCKICGKKSRPEAKSAKRSIGMHIKKEHNVPTGEVEQYREEITESSKETGVVYIVQAEFEDDSEAKSEKETLVKNEPDLKDFIFRKDNYLLVKCSTHEKGELTEEKLNKYINPVTIDIKEEEIEEGNGNGLRSSIPDLNVFGSKSEKQEEEPEAPSSRDDPRIIGRTISTDDYKHFQMTEADATDMEGLMMARQQIAKGEGLKGHDPMKWVAAISVLMIIIVVVLMMLEGVDIGGMIPGVGGGGGETIP